MCDFNGRERGFTIVELLIVIVVIGILAAITAVAYNSIQRHGRVSVARADLHNLATAMEIYKVDNGRYPTFVKSTDGPAPELEKILRAANVFETTRWVPAEEVSPKRSFIFCMPGDNSQFAIAAYHPLFSFSSPAQKGDEIIYVSSQKSGVQTITADIMPGKTGLTICQSIDGTYMDRWSYSIPDPSGF